MASSEFDGIKLYVAPEDAIPVCPKCDRELTSLWVKTMGGGWGHREQSQIVMCPQCRAFLGYGTSMH